jgi:hypothetical protein
MRLYREAGTPYLSCSCWLVFAARAIIRQLKHYLRQESSKGETK